ncbi:cytochrome b5-like [Phragmites australis]|uniref:cytochrome b5-like n=1 Tax=Phragmites australis TaxID=29695 RepID=UPI002D787891|nr:cytochrome b5-like [Phragmites australis]
MAGGKVYSFEEVRKHNDRKDCWLIISGKVYDVTPFMEEHPGGDEVLLASTGKDATTDFQDIGHTDSAKELMPQYCIGEVDAATIPAKLTFAVHKDAPHKKATTSTGAWATLLQLAAPLVLLALAFALQSFGKAKTE